MTKKYLSITLLVFSFFLSSCGSGDNEGTLSGSINIDGSSTVFPITEAVAEEFRSEAPNVRVTVGVSGTGGGFQKFLRGETAINDASREIKPTEIETAKQNGIEYIRLSVAYDGLAVVVNPQNDWVDNFTVEELQTIWEPSAQGNITRWNQIRSEWPDEEIHLYGPGVASGTYDYFTEAIVGESGSSRGDFTASEDDNVLVQGVSSDQFALGFFGLAYFEENQEQLKLVGVKDGEGEPVKPSTETVANGTYTPLSRPLFIYVSKQAAQRPEVQNFIEFYLDTAPKLAKSVGYVAMPDSAYNAQKEKFQAFISDSTAVQ
ncbi:PstS family phosphate ABC transporter substrate-binding protein [Aliifodinibius sp. S!AR15-10]|uniref:PstS family phosphate ABC transporter substrate-binding protein n=1 Tax=Aliifodinibius sp. S!AR15-10 TaxID=2950437 RepID=UPI002867038F|nr:PstS family phosphate ABC transporter substrate-binding protein [Aliifodinibius sp. S!AR15-10]MDR8390518.1 PstS family phosphate ABC transporter substrate-binding protein [Aliifodinibius sp. S!AR15-10]